MNLLIKKKIFKEPRVHSMKVSEARMIAAEMRGSKGKKFFEDYVKLMIRLSLRRSHQEDIPESSMYSTNLKI